MVLFMPSCSLGIGSCRGDRKSKLRSRTTRNPRRHSAASAHPGPAGRASPFGPRSCDPERTHPATPPTSTAADHHVACHHRAEPAAVRAPSARPADDGTRRRPRSRPPPPRRSRSKPSPRLPQQFRADSRGLRLPPPAASAPPSAAAPARRRDGADRRDPLGPPAAPITSPRSPPTSPCRPTSHWPAPGCQGPACHTPTPAEW